MDGVGKLYIPEQDDPSKAKVKSLEAITSSAGGTRFQILNCFYLLWSHICFLILQEFMNLNRGLPVEMPNSTWSF
jgi:hypothetical protein